LVWNNLFFEVWIYSKFLPHKRISPISSKYMFIIFSIYYIIVFKSLSICNRTFLNIWVNLSFIENLYLRIFIKLFPNRISKHLSINREFTFFFFLIIMIMNLIVSENVNSSAM
jgi:hypothetical protein